MYRLIKLINIHAKVYLDLFIHLKVIYLKANLSVSKKYNHFVI